MLSMILLYLEGSLFAEVMKWIVMGIALLGVLFRKSTKERNGCSLSISEESTSARKPYGRIKLQSQT